jgi:hypothetical protein
MRSASRAHCHTFLHPRGYRRLALSRLWIRRDFAGRGVRLAASIIGAGPKAGQSKWDGSRQENITKIRSLSVTFSGFWRECGQRGPHPADIPGSGFGTPIAIAIMFERERLEAEARQSAKDVRDETGRSSAGNRRATLRTVPEMGPFWEASDWPLRAEGHLSGRGDGPKALMGVLSCARRCACFVPISRV